MTHKHPGSFGTSFVFFADHYLPPRMNDEKVRYWGHACNAPFCRKVWFEGTFYEDATDEDLVFVAEQLSARGQTLHIPDQRLSTIAPPGEDRDFRSPSAREDILGTLATIEDGVPLWQSPRWGWASIAGALGGGLSLLFYPHPGVSFSEIFLRCLFGAMLGPLTGRCLKALLTRVGPGFWPFS